MTIIVDLTPRHHLHTDTIFTDPLVDVSAIPQNRIDLLHDHLTFSSSNYFIIDRITVYAYPTKYLCRLMEIEYRFLSIMFGEHPQIISTKIGSNREMLLIE